MRAGGAAGHGGDELRIEPGPQSSLRSTRPRFKASGLAGFLAIPPGWQPWWRNAMHDTLLARPERLEITADAVSMGSLVNSAKIKVLRDSGDSGNGGC